MKKFMALLVSAIFDAGMFMLLFLFSIGRDIRWFIWGFPLISAVYFVIIGNVFFRRLELKRWQLWLCMNVIGGLGGWLILLAHFPSILFNGAALFLFGMASAISVLVWAVIGAGFLYVKWVKRRTSSSDKTGGAVRFRKAGKWTAKAKELLQTGSVVLVIVAAAGLFIGIRDLSSVRPAGDYEDKGVHTFVPYDILSVRVGNTAGDPYEYSKKSKIVYKVYYRTTDGSGYQWSAEGGSVRTLAEQLYDRGAVERRVLLISGENTYVTIEADETAESYTTNRKITCLVISTLSVLYLFGWIVAALLRRAKRLAAEQTEF